jgi:uncharacterized membrane protein YccC
MARMENYFIWSGIALCLFSLWAIARHDWLRLTRPTRRITARVTGHRSHFEENTHNFAAVFSFTDETGLHEVVDGVFYSDRRPTVGTLRELRYPAGRPDLARPPRPLLWSAIYATIMAMAGMLFGKWMGWLH